MQASTTVPDLGDGEEGASSVTVYIDTIRAKGKAKMASRGKAKLGRRGKAYWGLEARHNWGEVLRQNGAKGKAKLG